ncbi:MAG: glycine cleavage system protein H [Dehalococcoidia bacterium]|nr:glycine cleavage system protein H [Dehalococcoidia bacterium]|tara:strand:+ start:1442 stop:1819 length:378 start_codon:yes stop_codon:yes gene_type:complete
MAIPQDLKYTEEHEWIRVTGDIATVGITDYAQDQLGDVVYVDLPSPGTSLTQFGKLGEIESVKAVSDIYAPLTGEVVESNTDLNNNPEVVNTDPYEKGWLVKVKIANTQEIDGLLSAESYEKLTS